MATRLMILNGPNLGLLGVREPEIYGSVTLAAIERSCRDYAGLLGASLAFHQSDREGDLLDWIHQARGGADVLILNPAGLSFRSVALLDALKALGRPVIEVHLSNIHARDAQHRHSILSQAATAVICGMGAYGYILAMQAAARLVGAIPASLPEPVRVGPQ